MKRRDRIVDGADLARRRIDRPRDHQHRDAERLAPPRALRAVCQPPEFLVTRCVISSARISAVSLATV